MVLCGTKNWLFYGIAVKNLLSNFIFKSVYPSLTWSKVNSQPKKIVNVGKLVKSREQLAPNQLFTASVVITGESGKIKIIFATFKLCDTKDTQHI